MLFVEPNPGRSDTTFFTDRVKGELWVGPRLGVEQSRARYGVDECRALADLPELAKSLHRGATRPWRLLRDFAPALACASEAPLASAPAGGVAALFGTGREALRRGPGTVEVIGGTPSSAAATSCRSSGQRSGEPRAARRCSSAGKSGRKAAAEASCVSASANLPRRESVRADSIQRAICLSARS